MGAVPGCHVCLCGANNSAYTEAFLGVVLGGFVPINVSVHLPHDHLVHLIREARPLVVLCSRNMASRFKRALQACVTVESAAPTVERSGDGGTAVDSRSLAPVAMALESTEDLVRWAEDATAAPRPQSSSSSYSDPVSSSATPLPVDTKARPVLVLYTSGSTGRPKGAVMSDSTFCEEARASVKRRKEDNRSPVTLLNSPWSASSSPYDLLAALVNGGRIAVYKKLPRVFEVAEQVPVRIINVHLPMPTCQAHCRLLSMSGGV